MKPIIHNKRDSLFYKDAIEAIDELEKELGKDKPKIHKPSMVILGSIAILVLVTSLIPLYSMKVNPPPSLIKINYFKLAQQEELALESLNTEHFSTINEAISNMNKEDYRDVSVRLATSACRTSSRVCYSKALYTFIRNRIAYINDPASREYVQLPQKTLLQEAGDCDDKSLALAAMLESIGIDADVGVTSNHAFVRVNLPEASFWIRRNSDYVYLDPSSNRDFGEISFREEEIVRFYEIY
ncbi:MAG: transglutaminase domain-containing protein [Candidatus Woesearchaeota archaeon]|nr:MAG: transglutaminase domain-containing protein [Candidatus Woesearchaeota archaeon]